MLKNFANAAILFIFMFSSAVAAQTTWRTPPINLTSNQATVSCDLLNNSGQSINTQFLRILVKALEGGSPSIVVAIPGPQSLADGRGFSGSTAMGLFPYRTVYCEIESLESLGANASSFLFIMTVSDAKQNSYSCNTTKIEGTITGAP